MYLFNAQCPFYMKINLVHSNPSLHSDSQIL